MNGFAVRAFVALLFAAFLWLQSRASQHAPYRYRTFALAAAALLAFAALNGLLAFGMPFGPVPLLLVVVGLAFFGGSLVAVVQSLRDGEMREQRNRISDAVRVYHEQRLPDETTMQPRLDEQQPPTRER